MYSGRRDSAMGTKGLNNWALIKKGFKVGQS